MFHDMFRLLCCALLLSLVSAAQKCVCVVGGGSIGASFCTTFLAKGLDVNCYDPFLSRQALEERITELWPSLRARGWTRLTRPPLHKLKLYSQDLHQATKDVQFVQECTWEQVDSKQLILQQLDQIVDPQVIISSSTSFITWPVLSNRCRNNKDRVVIGHPAIPHMLSFMEIYATTQKSEQAAKQFYTSVGFDSITMNKTVPGHVWNSVLVKNIDLGHQMVRNGVCSAEDYNKCLRHFGRACYAHHMYLSLLTIIGGAKGVDGGVQLSQNIKESGVYLVLFSALREKRWVPRWLAHMLAKSLGSVLLRLLPAPPPEYIKASRDYESRITHGHTLTPQVAVYQQNRNAYSNLPLEVDKDYF